MKLYFLLSAIAVCLAGCSSPVPNGGAAVTFHAQAHATAMGLAAAQQSQNAFWGGKAQ